MAVGGGARLKVRSKGRLRGDLSPLVFQALLFLACVDVVRQLLYALQADDIYY